MKTQKFMLDDIPSILWGEDSNKVYVHVHGKMGRKEYAESFAAIAETKGYQTLSFDLPEHGERTDPEEMRCMERRIRSQDYIRLRIRKLGAGQPLCVQYRRIFFAQRL